MREAVSDVLIARSQHAEGLGRMVVLSFAAHVVLVAALAIVPSGWLRSEPELQSTPITISLGGAPGPDAGGRNQISARPVQTVAPPEPKVPFTRAPAEKPPEMVAPEPAKPAAKTPTKPVQKPVERSTTRKPIAGEEIRSGTARVDTGGVPAFGQTGLSTAGGGGFGAKLDVGDFCCPEYVQTMVQMIRAQWKQNQGAAGQVVVKFTIRRDGMLTNVEVAQSSSNPLLDLESRRAVLYTRQLPPLPAQFDRPTLTVHLLFEYKR
jgi:TonB family protein